MPVDQCKKMMVVTGCILPNSFSHQCQSHVALLNGGRAVTGGSTFTFCRAATMKEEPDYFPVTPMNGWSVVFTSQAWFISLLPGSGGHSFLIGQFWNQGGRFSCFQDPWTKQGGSPNESWMLFPKDSQLGWREQSVVPT